MHVKEVIVLIICLYCNRVMSQSLNAVQARTDTDSAIGQQAFHEAVATGNLDKVMVLLETDPALLESKDQWNRTPLNIACSGQHTAIADYLMDKGADVNARNVYGVSVLSCAISGHESSYALVKRLIDKGAEINVTESDVGSPLHVAADIGNIRIAGLLIDHGANLNARGRHGTPLQSCILAQSPLEEMAIFLAEQGANPVEYSFGNNDLHLAAMKGYADLIQIMISHGADIHSVNDYNRTALYYASMHGHRRAADVLIAAGADTSTVVETNFGKAAQLSETLKEGEAYLWYLGGYAPGTGYAVKTRNNLLIFDPFKMNGYRESGLASGDINPDELTGQNVTVLLTRKEQRPFNPIVSRMGKRLRGADFVLSCTPLSENGDSSDIPPYHLATANESFTSDDLLIHTIQTRPSTVNSMGNLGYLVEVDGLRILHAGLHRSDSTASQVEAYRKEIDFLEPFGPVDIVILPVGYHHLGDIYYESYLYLIDKLKPKAIFLTGDNLVYEEHKKCLETLKARNVPVFYPEGGIALGQRFHYSRNALM